MGRLLGFAILFLAVAALSTRVTASDRRLQQAVASASATAGSGSSAVASATATSDGDGEAESVATADARDGGTAVADVTAEAEDGGEARGRVTSKATDGATVIGELDVKAEEDATAIVDLLLEASGDKLLAVQAWAQGLRTYEGNVIALTLKKSFDESTETGVFATEALAIAFRDLINEHPNDPGFTADTIVSAIEAKDEAAEHFGGMIIFLFNEEGCEFIRPILIEAEILATKRNKDKAFITAIGQSAELVSCIFNDICTDALSFQCCNGGTVGFGKCQCNGDDCNYRLFWDNPTPIWKCISEDCDTRSKCACPLGV